MHVLLFFYIFLEWFMFSFFVLSYFVFLFYWLHYWNFVPYRFSSPFFVLNYSHVDSRIWSQQSTETFFFRKKIALSSILSYNFKLWLMLQTHWTFLAERFFLYCQIRNSFLIPSFWIVFCTAMNVMP